MLNEYRDDLRTECEKFGTVKKVILFDVSAAHWGVTVTGGGAGSLGLEQSVVQTQLHLCAAETPGRCGVRGFQGSGGGRRLHPVVRPALVRRAAAVGSALGRSHRLSGKHTSSGWFALVITW